MQKPDVLDEEYFFEGRKIISTTDTRGFITHANRQFCEISGYSKDELIGQEHNIIRHPDMPKIAFKEMWKDLKHGKEWHGFVKNLRKDGRFYWVETHIIPNYDNERNIVSFTAARSEPKRKNIEEVIEIYKKLLNEE